MRKATGITILVFLLVIPPLVYLFIKQFGKNQYTLPIYFPIDTLSSPPRYHQVPDFSFISQRGDTITQKQLTNCVYVADFFFTRCGNICPQMTSQLVRIQKAFKSDSTVKIISYTIDPDYDQVDVLKAYARRYQADSSRWYFVTGDKKRIDELAQKGYYISSVVDSAGNIDHSQRLVLVDKERHIRGFYDGTDPKDVDRLLIEIRVLLYNNKNKFTSAN
jgi:protein SCO1/2